MNKLFHTRITGQQSGQIVFRPASIMSRRGNPRPVEATGRYKRLENGQIVGDQWQQSSWLRSLVDRIMR